MNSQVPSGDSEGGSESSNGEGGDLDSQEGPVVYRGRDGLWEVDTSIPDFVDGQETTRRTIE